MNSEKGKANIEARVWLKFYPMRPLPLPPAARTTCAAFRGLSAYSSTCAT